MHSSSKAVDLSVLDEVTAFIQGSSNISILALIPPVFVILAVALKMPAIPSLVGGVFIGVPLMFWNKPFIEAALGLTEKGEQRVLLDNIFNILNNGISMGNVPEGASKVINELASLLSCD
ncbi:hypothetical protein RFZ44_08815, partial [Acinetobacter sp. 163]|nr:hypothetical protein [Acinetobacter sp. 163]